MEEEEKKEIDDIEEDKREAEESIVDEPRDPISNDVAEDLREEGESIDDLKRTIAEKDAEIERLKSELEQVHKDFLNSDIEVKKDFETLKGEIL